MLVLKNQELLQSSNLINGQWLAGKNAAIKVVNPATGELLSQISSAGAAETEMAIDAAEQAQKLWCKQTAQSRAKLLLNWYQLIMANQEDLAKIMTAEQGKPLAEAKGEIAYAASFIEWFAEEGKRIYGDVIPSYAPDRKVLVTKEPVGVCAAITPWNFPAAMITRKVGPALAAGCTMVIKPAEETPHTALALGKLALEAGIPAGVINIVVGPAEEVGQVLTDSTKVAKLSFTGSTRVGKLLMKASSDSLKKVSLELGGNAPFIVFNDADIDEAVSGAILSKFRNAGQTCVCANRIYVQSKVYDEFIEKFTAKVSELAVGNGMDNGVEQGPLINDKALNKVNTLVADAIQHGGKVLIGGAKHELAGNFYQPTVISNANNQMKLADEEIFGPVAPVFKFETEQQVIELANDTEFGLASYFYARDIGTIWRVADALQTGIVGVNTGVISTEVAPFGGVKASGIGREGSKYGIEDYINIKYICMAGLSQT